MNTPALIIGASGQVGQQVRLLLDESHRLLSSSREAQKGWLSLDLATIGENQDRICSLLERSNVRTIYCLGGMTDVEHCESDSALAMKVNCIGPSILARVAAGMQVGFVYFSSEYVFDGRRGPYDEDAVTKPLSAYGRSKVAGELGVMREHPAPLIIRTTVVYGPDAQQKNFLYSLRNSLGRQELVLAASDQISTPTYNVDLALATVQLVESGATGIYHVAGPELMSRAEFAIRAATVMGMNTNRITSVPTANLKQKAARPLNAGLRISKLLNRLPAVRMRCVEEALGHWLRPTLADE